MGLRRTWLCLPMLTMAVWVAAQEAPPSVSAEAVTEDQASFHSPVTNTGAFVHSIPIEVPQGIGDMTPQLALVYSSRGGMGVAGVGWDLPYSAIALNPGDGFRPGSVEEDLARYEPNMPVERYSSNFGTLTVLKDQEDYASATKTFLFNPHNDQQVDTILDEANDLWLGGDRAAWLVSLKDGTKYRYGYTQQASLIKDAGDEDKERKVAWMLDQVEDRHGNLMLYYYEIYPNRQLTLRQPVLRYIEYGIPARNPATTRRIVVELNYIESPWKRFSYNLGTKTDTAFLLDEVCVYAKTHVVSEEFFGRQGWKLGIDVASEGVSHDACTELTYDFESSDYEAAYTGRPLLMKVQTVARDGSKLPPYEMSYSHQGTDFEKVLYAEVIGPGEAWQPPYQKHPFQVSHDIQHAMMDLNGDGLNDVIEGSPVGAFDLALGQEDGSFQTVAWDNPLSALGAVSISGTENSTKDTAKSDCWHKFDYNLSLSGGAGGLAFTRALTRAPEDFWYIYRNAGKSDEFESYFKKLGGFQFLRSSYYGPYPAFGKKNLTAAADFIDELETFGSWKKDKHEYAFDWRASDCRDWGDKVELDYCWDIGLGGDGMLGADHGCLDNAGSRWFTTAAGSYLGYNRSYATGLWDLRDMDGDGLLDWVYAANIIGRNADGDLRNFANGANDWYWARNTGLGWGTPQAWHVPAKTGSSLGLESYIDFVHGTSTLYTSVSTASLTPQPAFGIGVSIGVGYQGFAVSPSLILGGNAVGLPTSSRGLLRSSVSGVVSHALSNYASPQQNMAFQHASAAVSGVGALAGGNALVLLPSASLALTTQGPKVGLHLPVIGDVLTKFQKNYSFSTDYFYQGMVDLNGDGRPDLVSARWDAGSAINPNDYWLFYRNSGSGFDDPELWHFAQAPAGPSGSATPDAISATLTDTFVKHPFDWGIQDMPFGNVEQYYGLADINGDGLLDYVDADNYEEVDPDTGLKHKVWWVHFNEGEDFGSPVAWAFEGDWHTQHGSDCTHVYGSPRVSRSVFGHPNYANGGLAYSRQVQGLFDANGDGLMDFWYVQPMPQEGPGSSCGYFTSSIDIKNDVELEPWISPFDLNGPLLLRLNTGSSFAEPIEWSSDISGHALNGGVTDIQSLNDPPVKTISQTVLSTGDFDNDGAIELALRSINRGDDNDYDWTLYNLSLPNQDALTSIVNPSGGVIEVEYSFKQNTNGEMGAGQWVASSVRSRDQDPSRLDVTHRYRYERGVYDRDHRTFLGFERVYDEVDSGYTVSRYYQRKGFEGRLYCREVRSLEDAPASLAMMVEEHETEWRSAPPDTLPAGYVRPVGIGSPADGLVRPRAAADEDEAALANDPDGREDGGGAIADGEATYGGDFSDPDDPAQEAAEGERWANDKPEPAVESHLPLEAVTGTYDGSWGPGTDFGDPLDPDPEDSWDGPPGRWWDQPFYDPCPPGGSVIIDGVIFVCDPDDITSDMLVCGDEDDPGRLVRSEFFVLGDHSGLVGIAAPKLRSTYQKLYDAQGANPLITKQSNTLDEFGRIASQTDFGDETLSSDNLLTRYDHVTPNLVGYLVDFTCHEVQESGAVTLRETWWGYDGQPADGQCGEPVLGNATQIKRAVDGSDTVVENFGYNEEGMLWSHTNAKGRTVVSVYHQDFPWFKNSETWTALTATGPQFLTRQWLYNGVDFTTNNFGQVVREVDFNGQRTEYTYDRFQRLLSVQGPLDDPAWPKEAYVYGDFEADGTPTWPHRVTVKRLNGAQSYSEEVQLYDGFGNAIEVQRTPPRNIGGCEAPDCHLVAGERLYDGSGRVIQERLPHFSNRGAGQLFQRSFDLLGRETQRLGVDGTSLVTAYDRELTAVREPTGQVTLTRHDGRGFPLQVTEYIDGGSTPYATTSYEHNVLGELMMVTDDAGNTSRFTYDLLGRRVEADDPDSGISNLVYDRNGNVAISHDARFASEGLAVRTVYDHFDQPVAREVRQGATIYQTELVGGDLLEAVLWAYHVDPAALPDATLTDCAGHWKGRLTRSELRRFQGTTSDLVSRKDFCYDAEGRVLTEHHTIGSTLFEFAYQYNAAGWLEQATYPGGEVISYTYDEAGRLESSHSSLHGDLLSASFVNAVGQPTKRKLGAHLVQRYCYEPGGQGKRLRRAVTGNTLAGPFSVDCEGSNADDVVSGAVLHDVAYGYATSGQLVSRDETFEDPIAGTTTHAATYEYDDRNRLAAEIFDGVRSEYAYDTVGNLTRLRGIDLTYGDPARSVRQAGPRAVLESSSGYQLRYDDAGRVTRIDQGDRTLRFYRNGHGLPKRIAEDGVAVAKILYDENQVRVKETRGSDEIFYSGNVRQGPNGTELSHADTGIGFTDAAGGAASFYFVISDHLASTTLLVDQSSLPTQAAAYHPYGASREESVAAGAFTTDRLFAGKRRQEDFNGPEDIYTFGPRLYFSDLGRWLSPDDSLEDGFNRYAFVRNNPILHADPSGRNGQVFLWTLYSSLCDFCAGYFDGLTFGITEAGRDYAGWSDSVDQSSWAYFGGGAVGVVAEAVFLPELLPLRAEAALGATQLLVMPTDAQAGGRLRIGSSGLSFRGAMWRSLLPEVAFDYNRAPDLVANMLDAQRAGYSSVLTYAGPGFGRTNRRFALGNVRQYRFGGFSWDEYPFASTLEGGAATFLRPVPVLQQSYQGGVLGNFYRSQGLTAGDRFRVVFLNVPDDL